MYFAHVLDESQPGWKRNSKQQNDAWTNVENASELPLQAKMSVPLIFFKTFSRATFPLNSIPVHVWALYQNMTNLLLYFSCPYSCHVVNKLYTFRYSKNKEKHAEIYYTFGLHFPVPKTEYFRHFLQFGSELKLVMLMT